MFQTKEAFKKEELTQELMGEMQIKEIKQAKTSEVIAVACAAYRINKNEYVRDTRRFSTPENNTLFANKELVKMYFGAYRPEDYIPFQPTEEDYAQAEEIRKWMKRYVLLGLGDLPEFKRDMVNAALQEETTKRYFGILAFIPAFVKRDKHESGLKKEIRVEYRDSKHLGKVKDTVEGVIKILDGRYSDRWESYNYTAVMDGNLVSFMNKYKHENGTMKRIKAKVRSLTENRLFGANETRLNYVKLFKV
jgi:hypothetical protein